MVFAAGLIMTECSLALINLLPSKVAAVLRMRGNYVMHGLFCIVKITAINFQRYTDGYL